MALKTLRDFFPTAFDHSPAAFLKDQAGWIVAPCGRTRDSDALERSNFDEQRALLDRYDVDGESVETHRFGHWGPGWYEITIVKPESAAHAQAVLIADRLDGYPSLNDERLSEYEVDSE
jgi:hypothetical protein